MKVLIAGISSVTGRQITQLLLRQGHEVKGIDRRPWTGAPSEVEVYRSDIRKRAAEDVFRTFAPDAVVHMATVTHLERTSEDRFRINLGGTRKVFDHAYDYGVKKVIFVGRHTVYGAAPDSPLYHREDSTPMAGTTFPELSDLVAADLFASQTLWRHPEIDTAVLRFVYELGPSRHATLASFLKGPRVPMVLGFDPLFHFMHEWDMARAIVASLDTKLRGVFNVAGPAPVPLSLLIKETGRIATPIPEPAFRFLLGRFGIPYLPPGAVDHVKYPVVIDDRAFREATGFRPRYDEMDCMRSFREGRAPDGTELTL